MYVDMWPPWGCQICDTIVKFSVCVQIASLIWSSVWTGSSERERDSGANLWSLIFEEHNLGQFSDPPSSSADSHWGAKTGSAVHLRGVWSQLFEPTAPNESAILRRLSAPPT